MADFVRKFGGLIHVIIIVSSARSSSSSSLSDKQPRKWWKSWKKHIGYTRLGRPWEDVLDDKVHDDDDTDDDQIGDNDDDFSKSYAIFMRFIFFIKIMVKLHRRKANVSSHMQTDMIEVDFGFIINAGITMILIYCHYQSSRYCQ